MNAIQKAYQRGATVASRGHMLAWYQKSLEGYSEAERRAFLAGFHNEPLTVE